MWHIEYKIEDQAIMWRSVQLSDEQEAMQYALELLADGFIVRVSEE